MSARADAELVRRGLARSRRHAGDLVLAGRVRADGAPVTKPSTAVAAASDLVVEARPQEQDYVSRAGHKLAGALDALVRAGVAPTVAGAHCLDLGASTGGFTQVLVQRGAAQVVALDVGHGQLAAPLRADPRVVVLEGRNVRELRPDHLAFPPELVVADLSFISLRIVLPTIAGVARPGARVIVLVKPQFEVGRERLGRGGVVRDPGLRARAVVDVGRCAAEQGLLPSAVVPSPLPGPSGNVEYFLLLRREPGSGAVGSGVVVSDVVGSGASQAPGPAWMDLETAAARAVAWVPAAGGRPDGAPPTPPVLAVGDRPAITTDVDGGAE